MNSKKTLTSKRPRKLVRLLKGHKRNVLSLPGNSVTQLLKNLKVPVQLDKSKKLLLTPNIGELKDRELASYSKISEAENEDESVNMDTIEKAPSLRSYVSESTDNHSSRESDGQINSLINKIKEEAKNGEVPPTSLEYYRISKLLGEGSYGKVYRGESVLLTKPVAIKCYDRTKITSNSASKRIMQEIEILKFLNHPNVVGLYEIFENHKYLFMVIEYVDCGDLLNYLKENGLFEEEEFMGILKQIMEGLYHLHSHGILHRDIKLDNVLVAKDGKVKICDFGVSRKMPKNELIKEHIGTPAYLAPEIIKGEGYKGFQADVWSLGVLSYIALTGQVPFKGNKIEELHNNILTKEPVFEEDCDLSEAVKEVIIGMLCKDPKKRLTLRQIAAKLGFSLQNWDRLDTEYQDKKRLDLINSLGYPTDLISDTLENEEVNHIYALYKLIGNNN